MYRISVLICPSLSNMKSLVVKDECIVPPWSCSRPAGEISARWCDASVLYLYARSSSLCDWRSLALRLLEIPRDLVHHKKLHLRVQHSKHRDWPTIYTRDNRLRPCSSRHCCGVEQHWCVVTYMIFPSARWVYKPPYPLCRAPFSIHSIQGSSSSIIHFILFFIYGPVSDYQSFQSR